MPPLQNIEIINQEGRILGLIGINDVVVGVVVASQ
jgi:hypothetical protein